MKKYTEAPETPLVIYAANTRDRTQGFLHTGDFSGEQDVESVSDRKERRMQYMLKR